VKAAIQDAYALSPMQEGILFQCLAEPGTGLYVVQQSFRLESTDAGALRHAFQDVVDRHAVLRTAFAWQGLEKPLQLVGREVRLPWEDLDWSHLAPDTQTDRLRAFLDEDRRRGFDFSRAPLLRVAAIRTGAALELVFTFHHLLLDGWSTALLLSEVLAAYVARRNGGAPPPSPARPFKDYVRWLESRDPGRSEAFWREALGGFDTPTPLGLARPRRAAAGEGPYRAAQRRLSQPTTEALQAFARAQGLAFNTIVQGAWALALSRYSGQRDVLYGAVTAGRPPELEGSEAMLGLFINTLPVRVRVDEETELLRWLAGLQRQQGELRDHEHTPLVLAHGCSGVPRDRPLFESLLAFENYPAPRDLGASSQGPVVRRATGIESTHYPLTVAVAPGRELLLRLVYDSRRLDDATVERVLEHLATLFAALPGGAGRPLAELPLLPDGERQRVLVDWNDTRREYLRRPVPEQIEAHARLRPESLAVARGPEGLTYGELEARAVRLARALRGLGVGPEVLVGVCLERSPELVVALVAILKAGAAYVPLDPAHPAERLAFMLRDAQAPVVLTHEGLRDRVAGLGARVICLDREETGSEGGDGCGLPGPLDPASLAYVVYTSGSTGRPKGVEVTHGGLAHLVAWHRRAYALVPQDRTTLLASLSFDASVWEIWPTLTAGASLHLPDETTRSTPAALRSWLVEQDISVTFLPTPLAEAVLQEPWPEASPALRWLLTGGDRLHPLAPHERAFRVVNHYGPTEVTVVTTAGAVDHAQDPGDPAIGRPIDNTRVYVLDRLGRPVPQGVAGELYIGGDGLARGYLRRPELTAERFVPDCCSGEPGARLYRTGDLVRHLEDGCLEFLGRADDQVKIRGFRVEPGEIEAALFAHPAIREAAVVAGEDGTGGVRLIAYATLRPGATVAAEEIGRFLAGRVPDHMVPSTFEVLAALPLTPNGKIDRRALALREAAPARFVQGGAPRTPVEQGLAEIWAGVLGLRRVGIHEDFFERGGHSLLATRVIGQVRRTFDVELPLRALFESPTVARLAERVEAARHGARPSAPLVRADRARPLPLSFAQRRLWLLDRLQPGSAAYNLAASWALEGPLDTGALERALGEVVRRHEVLRTRLTAERGEPVQQVDPATPFPLAHADLSGLPEAAREEEARRRVGQEALRPFDLARGPVLRATLLRLGPERHVLMLTAHHVAFDGWSAGIFSRELAALYRAYREGRESPLPEPELQYADFAAWQQGDGGALQAQLAYWRTRLSGAPVLELPTDRPRPRVQTYVAGATPMALPAELVAALRRLCRREGATLFMALVAGVQALFHRYAGQSDFVIGSPIANRLRPELEGLIGFFINTLPLRADLRGDPSFRQLLERTRQTTLGAYDNQAAPFDRVVEELNPPRDASRSPLAQVIVALQNAPAEPFDLAGLTLRALPSDHVVTRFDLELHFVEAGEGVAGLLVYNADLWEPETPAGMVGHLRALLESAVGQPDAPLSRFSLVGPEEGRRLAEWGQGSRAAYPEGTVSEQLERVAAARGEAVAVVEGERAISYRELDARANRLARHLRGLGVAGEARVAVCLERSVELVLVMLATLKAGGAYLPLDPGHPAERLALEIEDAGATVLVTRRAHRAAFSGARPHVVCVEELAAICGGGPDARVCSGAGPDSLANVIYTSGSTGRPKGVEVTHRGVLRLLFGVDYATLGAEERLLMLAPAAFDASTFEIWGALLHGGTCVVHPEAIPSAQGLADSIRRHQVTTLWLTSSLFNAIVDESAPALRGLRQLLIGGEALSPEHVRRAQRELPTTRIVNGYGPTEGTVFACCHGIPSPLPEGATSVPIGRPLANTDVYVLDENLRLLPTGVPGELCLGGHALARGYLGRPGLTAERFVPSPFGRGARLYRTGDRVRWRHDGSLEFLGRADQQVKLRGHRIELGEIEAALTRLAGVREAVVTLREDRPADKRLVAYVVPAGPTPLDESALRAALRRTLPEYMVPAAFVFLPAFPRNANGKLDRAALPAPEATGQEGERPAPRDEIERHIAAAWCDMLGLERVGIHDNFFELGGNSLLLVRAHERLRPLFGARPPSVVELFEYSTVASLAERLRSDGPGSTDDARGAREERARQGRDRLEQRRRRRQEVVASGEDEGGA